MKTKSILAFCIALVMALLCCACTAAPAETEAPELTAAEIAEKMQEAMKATPCSNLETAVKFTMTIDAGEMGKLEMITENITEMTISQDPVSSHTAVTSKVTFAGETTETETENYTILEEGEMIAYLKSSGIWMKIPTGQTPEDLSSSASSAAVDLSNVTVDETVTEWNGQQVICLKTTLSGAAVENIVGGMMDSIGDLSGSQSDSANVPDSVDYSKLTCSTIIYLDSESFLPLAEETVFEGMTEMMAPLYQETGITVEVTDCTATGTFLSYEPQSAVTLPEGVAEKAEIWTRLLSGEPDNGDGTFTIREGMVLIDIVHPEGFAVVEKDYDHVTFRREDYREITYLMSYITNEQTPGAGDYFLAANNSSENRWSVGGGKVDRQQMSLSSDTLLFTCDILATTWGSGREDANLYAWTALANDGTGTYYLYIEISDGYNDGMGFSKNADITPDEFMAYLNAAAPSKQTAE